MAAAPSKEHAASALLSRAHSPSAAANIFRDKIQKQPLLLRPSSPDARDTARDSRRRLRQRKATALRRSKKPKPLSAAQKRALHVHDIPKEQHKYAIYEPMHDMWCAYIRSVLGLETPNQEIKQSHVLPAGAGPMLASADFHGALVEVVRSRCVARVGLKGIVVKDTKFTFGIVTARDQLKTVPKEHTVFRFDLPLRQHARPLVFELHGSQFETRPPDRANKKFKMHIDPDL